MSINTRGYIGRDFSNSINLVNENIQKDNELSLPPRVKLRPVFRERHETNVENVFTPESVHDSHIKKFLSPPGMIDNTHSPEQVGVLLKNALWKMKRIKGTDSDKINRAVSLLVGMEKDTRSINNQIFKMLRA